MKGIRFYEETRGKCDAHPMESLGNCIAVLVGSEYPTDFGPYCEGLAGVFARPNSPVAVTGVHVAYLRGACRRVSEARAREVHPALFERLDAGN